MRVRDAMAAPVATARPDDTIGQVAALMRREGRGFVPVVDDGMLVGVITDRDIVIRCLAGPHPDVLGAQVNAVMTPGAWTIAANLPLEVAAYEMAAHRVRRLPVIEDNRVVGVLSRDDVERGLHVEGPTAGPGPPGPGLSRPGAGPA